MRTLRISALFVTYLLLIACHRQSQFEEKLVGTWYFTTADADVETTLKRDHTLAATINSGGQALHYVGRWSLDGNDLIQEFDMSLLPKAMAQPNKIKRETIREITEETLTTTDNTYKRRK